MRPASVRVSAGPSVLFVSSRPPLLLLLRTPTPTSFQALHSTLTSSVPQRKHAMAVNKTIYVVTTAEGISTIHSTQDAANAAANALEGASVEEHELR